PTPGEGFQSGIFIIRNLLNKILSPRGSNDSSDRGSPTFPASSIFFPTPYTLHPEKVFNRVSLLSEISSTKFSRLGAPMTAPIEAPLPFQPPPPSSLHPTPYTLHPNLCSFSITLRSLA
ncbi:MAG: hypothetical protein F6J93_26385, partial [Oscillatoria sp. SIO1A7]|nr:hypothetical protein [Oscillatoria sp. SIO1A7]